MQALVGYDRSRFLADCGAGVTVGVVALPLAMAFAIASGVKPEQGIFTAIIAGFIISALGGSSVQIGGPAGAFIVIVYGIVQRYGVANLLIATVMAGFLLLVFGWLKLGALVRYIPVSIVTGFTNGIAVLIAMAQLKDLMGLRFENIPADFFAQGHAVLVHAKEASPSALGLGLTCFLGLLTWSKLAAMSPPSAASVRAHEHLPIAALPQTRMRNAIRLATLVPGPIVALVGLTAISAWLRLPVETIGTRFGGIPQALPAWVWPDFDWSNVQRLFVPTVTIAMLGAIESLLCARVADGMTAQRRHDPNQELMAQGIANIVAPFFGGIPATGTIARTVTNLRAGATSPVAGIVHAATLLVIVLIAAPLAASIPLPVLSGILLFVAWNMGEWHEFARLRTFPFEHRAKLVGTFLLTVMVDLTVAMEVGLAMACVVFVYRMSTIFTVERQDASRPEPGVFRYALHGPLFFGAVNKIESLPDLLPSGATALVLDATDLLSIDSSGLAALENLRRALARTAVSLMLVNLNARCSAAVERAGLGDVLGAER